jgi:hypothetical protein
MIPRWKMANMVATAKHINSMPSCRSEYKTIRFAIFNSKIILTRIRLYLKYRFISYHK